jgi:hypothetical protein
MGEHSFETSSVYQVYVTFYHHLILTSRWTFLTSSVYQMNITSSFTKISTQVKMYIRSGKQLLTLISISINIEMSSNQQRSLRQFKIQVWGTNRKMNNDSQWKENLKLDKNTFPNSKSFTFTAFSFFTIAITLLNFVTPLPHNPPIRTY